MDMRKFSASELQAARVYAARIDRQIADEALTATYYADHVTTEQREEIRARALKHAEEIEAGQHDGTFAIAQRMYYYLTGESVPFLPATQRET